MVGLLKFFSALGLYGSGECLWSAFIPIALFLMLLFVQGLYVGIRVLIWNSKVRKVPLFVPEWRSLILVAPYLAALFPCHFRCMLGHTVNALLHYVVLLCILVLIASTLPGATMTVRALFYFCSAIVATFHQPLFNYLFYWYSVENTELADAKQLLEDEELRTQKRIQRRLTKLGKSLNATSDGTSSGGDDAAKTNGATQLTSSHTKMLTIEDLYEISDDENAVVPFSIHGSDGADDDHDDRHSSLWGSTTPQEQVIDKMGVSAVTFSLQKSASRSRPRYTNPAPVDDEFTAAAATFAVFDDMDRDDWQPVFIKRTDEELERKRLEAISKIGGADEFVCEDVTDENKSAYRRAEEALIAAFEHSAFGDEVVFEQESVEEEPAPHQLQSLPTLNFGVDFLDDPNAGDVFDMFHALDASDDDTRRSVKESSVAQRANDRVLAAFEDEGFAARQLHASFTVAVEQAPQRRQPPPLPKLPEPPRYLKYMNSARSLMSKSDHQNSSFRDLIIATPRSEVASTIASMVTVVEQQRAFELAPPRTFLDDVLEDLTNSSEGSQPDDLRSMQKNERVAIALHLAHLEAEDERERQFEAAQEQLREMEEKMIEEIMNPAPADDPFVSAMDGTLVIETIATRHFLATAVLVVLALLFSIVLYVVANTTQVSKHICQGTLHIEIAIGIDIGVQLLSIPLVGMYRRGFVSGSVDDSVFSELHPYDGQRRLLAL